MYETWTRIRVKASGQIIDMEPNVARAMVEGGTADLVKLVETAALSGKVSTAALPSAQPRQVIHQSAARKPIQTAQARRPSGK